MLFILILLQNTPAGLESAPSSCGHGITGSLTGAPAPVEAGAGRSGVLLGTLGASSGPRV